MPRPSRSFDRALLASGRALFPRMGCAGLSVRAVAEHCGANPAMFHYHFRTKDKFLRTLLQQMYDEMFNGLQHDAVQRGSAAVSIRTCPNSMPPMRKRRDPPASSPSPGGRSARRSCT